MDEHHRSTPAQPLRTDAAALPLLMEAMEAATRFDAAACTAALVAAGVALTPRRPGAPHKSRADVQAALDAVEAGDFRAAHRLAWSAMTGLTWAFPPDITTCPQMPIDDTTVATVCGCGHELAPAARFCSVCGTPRTPGAAGPATD